MSTEIEEFKADRNAALLSLNEKTIRDFHRKWNRTSLPSNPEVFWGSVHKAITGNTDLPLDFRRSSKRWLDERQLKSLDDGDL